MFLFSENLVSRLYADATIFFILIIHYMYLSKPDFFFNFMDKKLPKNIWRQGSS